MAGRASKAPAGHPGHPRAVRARKTAVATASTAAATEPRLVSATIRPAEVPAPDELPPLQEPASELGPREELPAVQFQPLPQDAEPGPSLDPDGMFGPGDGWGSEAPTTAAGSTASSPPVVDAKTLRKRNAAFAGLAAAAFTMASGLVNWRLRLDEKDPTWLADEQDTDVIGPPAGRLIARHTPLPDGEDTSDLVDAIELAIGTAGYVMKNLMRRAQELNARRREAAAQASAQAPAQG